ncbi:hypothetical protein ACFL1X_09815 [Candidatus Hydrogenedentota bacterium]
MTQRGNRRTVEAAFNYYGDEAFDIWIDGVWDSYSGETGYSGGSMCPWLSRSLSSFSGETRLFN